MDLRISYTKSWEIMGNVVIGPTEILPDAFTCNFYNELSHLVAAIEIVAFD